MITKELLKEILKEVDIDINYSIEPYTNWLHIVNNTFDRDSIHHLIYSINIHELAHMCKEWAYDIGCITLESYKDIYDEKYRCNIVTKNEEMLFDANTEPAAIFQACQWILENK